MSKVNQALPKTWMQHKFIEAARNEAVMGGEQAAAALVTVKRDSIEKSTSPGVRKTKKPSNLRSACGASKWPSILALWIFL